MSKIRIINQPLRISDINFDDLNDETLSYWDHKSENAEIKRMKHHRKALRIDTER